MLKFNGISIQHIGFISNSYISCKCTINSIYLLIYNGMKRHELRVRFANQEDKHEEDKLLEDL